MAIASNNLSKIALHKWDLGSDVCPIPALEAASSYVSLSRNTPDENWQTATYPIFGQSWISHPEARILGDIVYLTRVLVAFLTGRSQPEG